MVPPPEPRYPAHMFDALTSLEAVERVAAEFEALLYTNSATNGSEYILEDLIAREKPEVVRLVLSCINPHWALSRFPTTPDAFNASVARKILSHLSVFFQFTPASVIDLSDEERPVGERADKRRAYYRQLVKDAPEGVRMSQKQMKQARRAAAKLNAPLDPAPFERLEIPVPETREEVEVAVKDILENQEAVLEVYLEALRSPELAAHLRTACLPVEPVLPPILQLEPSSPHTVLSEVPTATESADRASSYPARTLYCESASGFGEWAVNLAPRGERDLRDHSRRDRKIFAIIVKKIKELSNGHFSPDNQKRLNNYIVEIPIYEAKMTGDLRLVYQIDCVPAYDNKIFGIYTHAQIGRVSFWDSVGGELGKKGKEYRDRRSSFLCAFRKRPHHPGDHVFLPSTFPAAVETRSLPPGSVPNLPPDDLEQKIGPFLAADLDVAFVLQVSPRELDIIEHPYSCYVLGRSGTGKTTTMLYKMLLVETDYEMTKEETPKRRQLFVTQSRILAEKVEEHFTKLFAGYRPSTDSEKVARSKKGMGGVLVDIDDELNWRSDLPKKYSDLRDEHFPLFVTFDRLCGMIENDMEDEAFPSQSTNIAKGGTTKPAKLTYDDKFLQHYWPHFPQSLSKGLGSSTILIPSMTANGAKNPRWSLVNSWRERIYTLFESYLSQKRFLRDIDGADRTHAILKYFEQRGGVPGRKMDYLYVDETQDNLLIDTLGKCLLSRAILLRSICHNPNGLFWAGDTAQTISVGSSFRFNDLKAFLFRIEKKRYETNKRPELYCQPAEPPRTFQLTVNYRSHAGIVNCAHTVIEVISMFWPYAIDVLDPERGTVDGLRPVFFTGFDSGNVEYEQFLFGDREGSYIEFGAQQCILVRDDAAREKLREQVGDIGLIMTLYESKGLEFNDVLLYDFFETLQSAQRSGGLSSMLSNVKPTHPHLYSTPYAMLASASSLNASDTSARGEPMRVSWSSVAPKYIAESAQALWTSKDQVQNCTPGTDTPRLAMSSTEPKTEGEEWEAQGRKLFANKRYRQAKHCFERALLPRQAAIAEAYYLRQEARKSAGGNTRKAIEARKSAFLEAAAAFLVCARVERELAYFRIAGECFEDAGHDLRAAQAYQDAREFTRSAELYRKLGKFDEAVAIVKGHEDDIRPEVVANVINVARLFYFKEQKLDKANELFSSYEEALEYLEDRGLDVAHATLLESLGRFSDAAELHLEEGRTFEAIKLFLHDQNSEDSMRRGIQCILQGLWQRISFAMMPDEQDPSISRLLALAATAEVSLLSQSDLDEISMFQAIFERQVRKLEPLGQAFAEANNLAVALLCLDHCFTNPPKIQALQVDAVAQSLQVFHTYIKLLRHLTFNVDPCNSSEAEKLLGYTRHGENNFLIIEGTFLHSTLRRCNHAACHRSTEENILLSGSELRETFHRSLGGRLKQKVRQENEMCKITKAFTPCLIFSVFDGRCNRGDCPQEHIPSVQISARQYNLRVRIHLQQILIYQNLRFIETDLDTRKYWILRLYAALNPPFYLLGSASSLDLASIPEAKAGFQIVKEWVRSWVYGLKFSPQFQFLTQLAQAAILGFQFDRKDAMSYLTHGPYMDAPPSVYLRGPEKRYIVGEFLSSLEGKEQWCISAGVLFVRLPIHINVLGDFMEHLCTCIVVADRQQLRGNVHGVTLPLSWLMNWSSVVGETHRDTHTSRLLAESLRMLLEPVYSGVGAEHLLFDTKNLATLSYMIRHIFLARLYKVLDWITALRRADPTRKFHPLTNKYVYAESWTSLTRALRSSTTGSPLDEMVQLLHVDQARPHAVRGVRQIVYESIEDIPQLLRPSRSLVESTSWPGQIAVSSNNLTSIDSQPELVEEDDLADEEDALADPMEPEQALPAVGPVDMPVLEAVERPEEEIRAASIIQRVFKCIHKRADRRKAEMAESSLVAGCADFFVSCLKESVAIEWPTQEYRLRYLGPLPHLLLCLDIVYTNAQKQKKHIKKDLREAKHEKLEELDKRLTQVTNALKKVIQMQKDLGPKASIHVTRDLPELKRLASNAISLMRDLPFKTPEDLSQHLDRAYKGIVQPRVFVQAVQRKPTLNVDEEYY
ncbi:hypothetical protein B0H10DRAFT_1963249 [Mycena sp. CBHHK59/15]|nr:hypothetical protein B0H10DRAFT_1963249 [Mycena sp. CBHHK59/15]